MFTEVSNCLLLLEALFACTNIPEANENDLKNCGVFDIFESSMAKHSSVCNLKLLTKVIKQRKDLLINNFG